MTTMPKIENLQPLGQRFGRVPVDRKVIAEIQQAHRRGFNTMLMSDYDELAKVGLGPDRMVTVLPAAPRTTFVLTPLESLV